MLEISIQQVLAEIEDTETSGKTFAIEFVRSSGKKRGTLCFLGRCRKGGTKGYQYKSPEERQANIKITGLHTDKGTIPITDADDEIYLTPLISHLIKYNGMIIRH